MYMMLEITMTKLRQAPLGATFKQDQSGQIYVESVSPQSCASRSGLKCGDIVLAVENKPVNTVPQITKALKTTSISATLRIERVAENYILKGGSRIKTEKNTSSDTEDVIDLTQIEQDSFVIVENRADIKNNKAKMSGGALKSPEKTPSNENMSSKFAQTLGNFSLRKRKTSVSSDKAGGEGSLKGTPNSSTPNTPQHTNTLKQHSTSNLLSAKKHSICETPEINAPDNENLADLIEILKSKEIEANPIILFNEDFQFNLKDGAKYLNINVWGTVLDEKDVLLGYTNIPLSHVLNECNNSVLGRYMRSYSFLPPTFNPPNR